MALILKHNLFGTLVGTFGKGVPGSSSINFAPSSGANCDPSCVFFNKICYATMNEKRKPPLTKNLALKAKNFSGYLSALTEPRSLSFLSARQWIRFSAFGSIPRPETWTPGDRENLKTLAKTIPQNICHFPVETLDKAYALKDLGFNPRFSATYSAANLARGIAQGFPVSVVVQGTKRICRSLKNKSDAAAPSFAYARTLRAQGLTAKVCPAVIGSAKCGACKMCADPSIQVVIYPEHA